MNGVLRIARTEVLEHLRQPTMLGVMVAYYLIFVILFGSAFGAFAAISIDPISMEQLEAQLALFGVELDAWLYGMVTSFLALLFTNMPVFVALFAANSVIHERTCGTMPFLMLSPLTRWQLLAGKLSGAMALPLLLHLVFVGGATLVLGRLEVLADHSARMGGSLSWWIAFLVGGPAAAALLGTFGTVVSALARDMRTSLHYTNFFVFILGTGSGFVLVDGITKGLWLQLLFASGCLVVTLVGLTIGARLISRDVPPT